MAIVVVLPHWRLQHRMRYLALVSRTSACLISGWKLRAVFAHSLAIEGPLPDGRGSVSHTFPVTRVWWRSLSRILRYLSGRRRQIVFDVDSFGYIVGGKADDFVVGELAAVGGEDLRIGLGDVDGGFGFGFRLLCFFGN